MKFPCVNCGKEVDETEHGQYKNTLSSVDEALFDDSELCPECFEMMK